MIDATIKAIQTLDNLNVVTFYFHDTSLTMMSLELSDSLRVGSKVQLGVKATHVALGKNLSGELSYANQILSRITSIEDGELLSSIKLKYFDTIFESIITRGTSKRMKLRVDDEITILIKTSEIFIAKVYDA